MNKNDLTIDGLRALGLSRHESIVYLDLLRKPATHAQLSLTTGINRTTIYRLVTSLEKRGLVTLRIDDIGKFLVAADPSTLEVEVVTQEERAKSQRTVLSQLLPALEDIKKGYEADFAIHTYEGTEGFKRMLWHELKTEGDCLCIGYGALEDMVLDERWSEKHRQKTVEAGYTLREIVNIDNTPNQFTKNQEYISGTYSRRVVSKKVLPINHLMTIYNDTVATYNLHDNRRIGLEVVSKTYAETMRCIFESYWQIGTPFESDDAV